MATKVLVVDDEKFIVKGIKFSLEQDGMEVDAAYDGEEAFNLIQEKNYDIIILDVMLPKMDGVQVCQQVREFSAVPILMLTAKGEDMDKILGLEYGADDYMTKPFNILELKARIKAILRRYRHHEEKESSVQEFRDLKIDYDSRRVFIKDKGEADLTAKEFDLLVLFLRNKNKALYRSSLYTKVWGDYYDGDSRTVDLHVQRMRKKVGLENVIVPVYKIGYKLEETL